MRPSLRRYSLRRLFTISEDRNSRQNPFETRYSHPGRVRDHETTHHHWIQDPQSKFFSHPSTWSGDCPHAPRKMERLRISERSQGKGNTTFWSHSGGGGQLRCDGVQKTVQKTKNAGRGLSGNRRTIRKALLSRSCESLFETGKRNYGCLQEGRR